MRAIPSHTVQAKDPTVEQGPSDSGQNTIDNRRSAPLTACIIEIHVSPALDYALPSPGEAALSTPDAWAWAQDNCLPPPPGETG